MAEKGKRRKEKEPAVAYEMIAPPITGGEMGALLSAIKANLQSKRGDWGRTLAVMAGVPGIGTKEDIPLYGLGQSFMSTPAILSLINPELVPEFAVNAEHQYTDLLNKQLEKHGLPSSEELSPTEKIALAGGEMLSQLPVPEAAFAKVSKVVPKALKPLSVATEYFGPTIHPSAKSYLAGTGVGGALRIATDVPQEEEGPDTQQQIYAYPNPKFFEQLEEPTRKFGGGGLARAARRLASEEVKHAQPLQIMKEPGGQWLGGTYGVEAKLKPLTTAPTNDPQGDAVRNWIATTLTKYIKRDLGTEGDPVRALAERGITHFPNPKTLEDYGNYLSDQGYHKESRVLAGMPENVIGKSPLAKGWETFADMYLSGAKAGKMIEKSPFAVEILRDNPWLKKIDPETRINTVRLGAPDLGFSHLRDELQNSISPESNLPPHLKMRPESLQRMSVPQAVEHVAKIADWRKDQIEKARLAGQEGTTTFKDYPKQKMRWVQLDKPGQFKDESALMGHSVEGYEPGGSESYGLGGWPAIESGDAKIYSLRDDKGRPHVTIEVDSSGEVPSITQIKGKSNRAPKEDYVPFVQDFIRSGNWGDINEIENAGLVDARKLKSMYESEPDFFRLMSEKHGDFWPSQALDKEWKDYISPAARDEGHAKGGKVSLKGKYGVKDGDKSPLAKKYL